MTDGINIYVKDDETVVVGEGDGWGIWQKKDGGKYRFDIFAGGTHKAAPGYFLDQGKARQSLTVLEYVAERHPELREPFAALKAFVDQRWPA